MKKNRPMRVATILLALTLMTSCFVGSTFAKYTSTASGSDTARVAKWSIFVKDQEIALSESSTITFDLFNTIKDTGGVDEEDVAASLIAPGTSGAFELNVENKSEVDARYTITLAEMNNNDIPLQYSVDGNTWKDSVAELSMDALEDVPIEMGATSKQTVHWRWVFDVTTSGAHAGQDDASDTDLGIAARIEGGEPSVTITATIVAEQVD